MSSYLTINDVIDAINFDGFPDKELDALEQLQARTIIDSIEDNSKGGFVNQPKDTCFECWFKRDVASHEVLTRY